MSTFFWHDYETFGSNPRRDPPAQFAGLRTDLELEPVEEPVSWFCRIGEDCLPAPEACLVTGITPQQTLQEGLSEREFAARIHEQLARPGTCAVGYNSIRFDDEVTRFLLWRNFHEPYDREWQNGNSRWDLIDVARLCYALRPDGIEWPEHEPGRPSFRLEHLTAANGIAHQQAHDAVSDVLATVALARLLRGAQRRLFDYCLTLRDKRRALGMLDFGRMTPVLHVSSRYPAERGCLTMIAPICPHPTNGNGIIVYDLAHDPSALIDEDPEVIQDLVFTARADLPEDCERIALKVVHVNRSPVLAPLSVLQGCDAARIGLDPTRCERHLARLRATDGLRSKVAKVFGQGWTGGSTIAEEALYEGFVPPADRGLLAQVRSADASALTQLASAFADPRLRELVARYRCRNFPDSIQGTELERWTQWCQRRYEAMDDSGMSAINACRARISALRHDADARGRRILDQLESWLMARCVALGLETTALNR